MGDASVHACAAAPKLPRARNLAASRCLRSPTDRRARHWVADSPRCHIRAVSARRRQRLWPQRASPRRHTTAPDTLEIKNHRHRPLSQQLPAPRGAAFASVPQRSRIRSRLEHQTCSTTEQPRCSTAAQKVQTCGGQTTPRTHPRRTTPGNGCQMSFTPVGHRPDIGSPTPAPIEPQRSRTRPR